jgi:hypothetical protein
MTETTTTWGPFDQWMQPGPGGGVAALALRDLEPSLQGGPVAVAVQKCAKRKGSAAYVEHLLASSAEAPLLVGAMAAPVLPPADVVPLVWAAVDRCPAVAFPLVIILGHIDVDFAAAGGARLGLAGDAGIALRATLRERGHPVPSPAADEQVVTSAAIEYGMWLRHLKLVPRKPKPKTATTPA